MFVKDNFINRSLLFDGSYLLNILTSKTSSMKLKFTNFFILFFLFLFASQAQVVKKGDKMFGGSLSFSVFTINNNGPQNYNTGNTGVFPSFGWAVRDNLTAGIRGSVNYNHTVTNSGFAGRQTTNSFTAGPGIFLKKYRLLKNKFGVYFDHSASIGYVLSKQKNELGSSKSHAWTGSYTFSPGVFYQFSDSFFGEANIGGAFISYYDDGNSKNYGTGASFLQYFNLGITYRIPHKKS